MMKKSITCDEEETQLRQQINQQNAILDSVLLSRCACLSWVHRSYRCSIPSDRWSDAKNPTALAPGTRKPQTPLWFNTGSCKIQEIFINVCLN